MINIKHQLQGEFQLRVINSVTGEDVTPDNIKEPFSNLITNAGLNEYMEVDGNITSISDYCRLGTSNSAPSVGQTSLGNSVGSYISRSLSLSSSGIETTAPEYGWIVQGFEFAAGTINGVALTEIGVFNNNSGSVMFSRTLIKDGGGNPTSITLDSQEILQVFWTFRNYIPTVNETGTVTIDGEVFDYTLKNFQRHGNYWDGDGYAIMPNYFRGAEAPTLPPDQNSGIGDWSSTSSVLGSTDTYVTDSFELTASVTLPIGNANYTNGIGKVGMFASSGTAGLIYAVSFVSQSTSLGIPKTSDDELRMPGFFKVTVARFGELP